jgi:spermidine synthase
LFVQTAVTLYAVGALALFVAQLGSADALAPIWTYLREYDPISPTNLNGRVRLFGALYFIVPAVLIVPPTILMGASFPLLQRAVQVSPAVVGRRVGWLQTVNIAGSMLGAMTVGWGSLRWFGTAGTLRVLALCGGAFALLLAFQCARTLPSRVIGAVVALVVVALVFVSTPRQEILWAKLHGTEPNTIIFKENDSGLSLLKDALDQPAQETWVYSNGLGQSWLPYGSVHTQLGMLGTMLHPAPASVAVIGLASGDTLYASGGSPQTKELMCIELVRPQYDTLATLAREKGYEPLSRLLEDSRVQWLFTDGRAYLQRSGRKFDVIEADALRPNSAYSGNLYSREYFQMVKTRLNAGGLAVTWVPTERTLATFLDVFPHALVVSGIAIGSEQRIDVSIATLTERLRDPFTREHYARLGDVRPLLAALFRRDYDVYLPDTPRPANIALNSDLFPRDEFGVRDR